MMLERSDATNWSTLKNILTSPRHYRHALTTPRPDTEALQLGRLVHCMVYEPDCTQQRYAAMPRFHGSWNDDTAIAKGWDGGKQARAAWDATLGGRESIAPEMWERATSMARALATDPYSAALIAGGMAEQPMEWDDLTTGIRCRGRVDHINGRLSDLKTTQRIADFPRQCASLRYHAQLAYYSDGLEANGFEFQFPPALIVVESVAPFDVAVYSVGPDVLAAGRALYRKALDTLAECRLLDRWPGVAGGQMQSLSLPAWAMASDDEEEITLGGERVF